jgi:hypothetical protein
MNGRANNMSLQVDSRAGIDRGEACPPKVGEEKPETGNLKPEFRKKSATRRET